MNRKQLLAGVGFGLAVLVAGLTVASPLLRAAAESGAVTMTVTAVGKKDSAPPPIAKNDVELYKGKDRLQVADWRKGETLLLAIVIDDSLGSNIASQWNDLKAFIMQ